MQAPNPWTKERLFYEIWRMLEKKWFRLIGWAGLMRFGYYYVSPDLKKCIYVEMKECHCDDGRYVAFAKTIKEIELSHIGDLVEHIYKRHQGAFTIDEIREAIRRVLAKVEKASK
jgi:hypothetical protein